MVKTQLWRDYLIENNQVLKHRSNGYRDLRCQVRAEVREKLGDQKGAIADLKIAQAKLRNLEIVSELKRLWRWS